jgi:hypothetical protein
VRRDLIWLPLLQVCHQKSTCRLASDLHPRGSFLVFSQCHCDKTVEFSQLLRLWQRLDRLRYPLQSGAGAEVPCWECWLCPGNSKGTNLHQRIDIHDHYDLQAAPWEEKVLLHACASSPAADFPLAVIGLGGHHYCNGVLLTTDDHQLECLLAASSGMTAPTTTPATTGGGSHPDGDGRLPNSVAV